MCVELLAGSCQCHQSVMNQSWMFMPAGPYRENNNQTCFHRAPSRHLSRPQLNLPPPITHPLVLLVHPSASIESQLGRQSKYFSRFQGTHFRRKTITTNPHNQISHPPHPKLLVHQSDDLDPPAMGGIIPWNNATHSRWVLSPGFEAQIPNDKNIFKGSIRPITPTTYFNWCCQWLQVSWKNVTHCRSTGNQDQVKHFSRFRRATSKRS